MSGRSVIHGTFRIDRRFEAKPEAMARWFSCHDDWVTAEHTLDFCVGGHRSGLPAPAHG